MEKLPINEPLEQIGDATVKEFASYIEARCEAAEQLNPVDYIEEMMRYAQVGLAITKFADWKKYENQRTQHGKRNRNDHIRLYEKPEKDK